MAGPHVHLNTYHSTTAFFFNLSSNEFLLTYREVKSLHQLIAPLKIPAKKTKKQEANFDEIALAIIKLSGPSQHYTRLFSFGISMPACLES